MMLDTNSIQDGLQNINLPFFPCLKTARLHQYLSNWENAPATSPWRCLQKLLPDTVQAADGKESEIKAGLKN